MLDNSDDDRYNGYGEYNKYSKYNKDYYYYDKRYERRKSLMMNLIIFLITT